MFDSYHVSLAPLFYCETFPGFCLKVKGKCTQRSLLSLYLYLSVAALTSHSYDYTEAVIKL